MKRFARQGGSVLRWMLVVLAILVLLFLAGVWYARENPLAIGRWVSRGALARGGLELREQDGQFGRLAYWEGGDGPTLVLMHGAGDQAGAFARVVPSLVADYRLIIPDLPGHGDSEPSEGPLSMHVIYGGLSELLAGVAGDEPPTLVGHSMGAWLAMVYAHRNPEGVTRVVAINGGPLTGDRPDLSLMPADREAARTLMAALRDPGSEPTPDFVLDDIVEQSAKGPIGRMMQAVADFFPYLLDGRLGEVTVPVDLLWGESDQLMSLAYAERMLAALPRGRLTPIPRCGHLPNRECPEEFATRLCEVLRMEPPAPAGGRGEPRPEEGPGE